MRKVIGIGETVLDIIFKNGNPTSALPGGSVFNAIVSLGRCGVPATMITEVGNDIVGRKAKAFLERNNVATDNVSVMTNCKSPISLAFLDDDNDAEYLFYKDEAHDRLEFSYPEVNPDDIVLFGSFFSVNPVLRPMVVGLLDNARAHGGIIYYDVNYRPAHRADVMRITPDLLDNLDYADIVRGSNADFDVLYRMDDADKVYESETAFYCPRLIYTQGAGPVVVHADNGLRLELPTPKVETVSTIGAGDNFNAGFIYALIRDGITRADIERGLTEEQWRGLVATAQQFAAESCKDIYNYVSDEFASKMKL